MTEPDSGTVSSSGDRPGRGLAVAAVSVAAVCFALGVATWLAWLLVRPRLLMGGVYPIVAEVFVLVLGGLAFVAALAGTVAFTSNPGFATGPFDVRPGHATLGR